MLQIARRGWTIRAVHAACHLARKLDATIVLVKMVAVQHVGWLGTELGYLSFTALEQAEMDEYVEIIEEYAVDYSACVFQYVSLDQAIVQMVEQAEAQVAFATLPPSIIPSWRKFQLQRLGLRLGRHHCQLVESPLWDSADDTNSLPVVDENQLTKETDRHYVKLSTLLR
jgi:hypothetical protein